MLIRSLAATLSTLVFAMPALAQAPNACTDFDAFVNGRWNASTELPAERARIGSFDTLRVANARLLEGALAELAAEPARQSSPGLKLLAAYYRSGMDTAGIAAKGLASVKPLLEHIDDTTTDVLPTRLGELAKLQLAAPLQLGIGPDAKDSTRNALSLSAGGLGLPDRDDYLRDDTHSKRLLQAYRVYAQTLLRGAGAPADDATIDSLLAFETEIARATSPRAQRRDPNARYNSHTPAQLDALAPGFGWKALLTAYGGEALAAHTVIVSEPPFLQALAKLAAHTPINTWRSYLRVRLLDQVADHLGPPFVDAHFAYRSGAIRGLKAPLPRVEKVILSISGNFGNAPLAESVGELYASKAFSSLAQQRALQMVADIKAAMHKRIAASPWMSEATQQLARAKLDAMAAKIGVPGQWKRYEGLQLDAGDYAGNLLRVAAWQSAQRLAELDRPVDRARWNTSPHIVNAFAASGNQIVFPAGILQPPFFDANADDASNYGAIGMVIGHEITHHFDDRGRQFDSVGNLRDWWQPQDAAAYKARAERVVQLYSGYEPVPGVRINGRLTLGENISDIGGIQIAFEGLQIALARQRAAGKEPPLIDGQTPVQRFFMANAVIWRSKIRTEALVDQLRTDGHSPTRWRVLAPMSNMAAFAKAFNCKAGDAMVAADPIVIW